MLPRNTKLPFLPVEFNIISHSMMINDKEIDFTIKFELYEIIGLINYNTHSHNFEICFDHNGNNIPLKYSIGETHKMNIFQLNELICDIYKYQNMIHYDNKNSTNIKLPQKSIPVKKNHDIVESNDIKISEKINAGFRIHQKSISKKNDDQADGWILVKKKDMNKKYKKSSKR